MHDNLVKNMCKEDKKKEKNTNKQDAYTCRKQVR